MKRMMLAVSGLALSMAAVSVHADASALSGVYTYEPGRSQNISTAIDKTVAELGFGIRTFAKSRLNRLNQPYKTINIQAQPNTISFIYDNRAPIVTPADGRVIKWTREDGEIINLSTKWNGDSLVKTYVAEDGERVNTYTLAPNGRDMQMSVKLTSSRLKSPLVYTLYYTKR